MTEEYLVKYARSLCKTFLNLEKDDLLSLNIDERDMDFARIVADEAMEITKNVVKILITENGKVQDVIDFEPKFPASQGKGFAMLHLVHVERKKAVSGTLLDTIVDKDNYPALQKLGHLADPQIPGRRISVPFCVAPVYESSDEMEKELINMLDHDLESRVLACTYRSQFFHHADIHSFNVMSDDCSFTFEVPEDCQFPCGSQTLPNGRKFVSSTDFDKIAIPVCKNTFSGSFTASFEVFGRNFTGNFVFENGNLVSYPQCNELRRFFDYDSNARQPGFVFAGDKYFALYLGGCNIDCVDQSLEELPSWFNECPYALKLELPVNLNGIFKDCEGKETEIIRKGFFLE